jgi:hypothetical protein
MQSQQNHLLLLAGCPLLRDMSSRRTCHSDACPVDRPRPTCSLIRNFLFMPRTSSSLRNMSSLRRLNLEGVDDASILDGCTFKPDSFDAPFPYSESLQKFLSGRPRLTNIAFDGDYEYFPTFDERCLPDLTCVMARPSWLGLLIVCELCTQTRFPFVDSFLHGRNPT